jgi:sRNA-binding carbon storage regulator CsrA
MGLVLTLTKNEIIKMGPNIFISNDKVRGKVKLHIDAPDDVEIQRWKLKNDATAEELIDVLKGIKNEKT